MTNSNETKRPGLRMWLIAVAALTGSCFWGASNAAAEQQCSAASLRGSYGFHGLAFIKPAETPRAIIGVFTFDGRGSWSANLTVNDNGNISQPPNTGPGTYVVNPDCTGTLYPSSGGSVAIVVVDSGQEFYQMRTDPKEIVLYGVTKKLFQGNN
jgi:hypothetical protein